MLRTMLLTAAVIAACGSAPPPAGAATGRTTEMQAARPAAAGGAMTPQRARRECWQSFGFGPNTPRNQYPGRLQPQVETCVAGKLRR
jgi:hypothetical protein